ncbi:hypothetical protein BKK50_09910 [Rodentibacter rarus]|uniref:Multidrug transporter n=1 Tax=Rodentibacter rarus TaxID=1908260 RepID=A0A1V3IGE7_9PAST|nr:MATE family Na+-driven efflux transporter [Rodentibacter rarus]OOF40118.1 hypothetical protein BKK50_09910 [Rodentibacter rarus]
MKIIKNFDIKLWLAFLLIMSIPTVINILRLHFIGTMPNDWGFNIASQIQWLNIIYEIIKEMLLVPLFFMLAQALKENRTALINNALSGLLLVTVIHSVVSVGIFFLAETLVTGLNQHSALIQDTAHYIKLESVAIMLSVVTEYLIVYLAVTDDYKNLIKFSLLKISLLIISDIFLISDWRISLNLGVNGIAISNILINGILTGFILSNNTIRQFIRGFHFYFDKKWFKQWFHLGMFSGFESLIRNTVFVLMILGMVNQIGKQGVYWIANSIIWGILLVPSLALAEVVKRDVAMNKSAIISNTACYMRLTIIFVILWLFSIPTWEWFLSHILIITDMNTVTEIMKLQTVFYIVFMFNNGILDSTIKALGMTKYMLYQSIFIDIFYYSSVFLIYKIGFLEMSLTNISLIFGFGMLMDIFPTIYLYLKALRKENISLSKIKWI